MLQKVIQKVFDVREGEFKISFWMLTYIFLIIAVLLIIKPTVNALFLSELGVEQLPFAFLLVAGTAIISSFFYTRALSKFSLNKIIEVTLMGSIIILAGLGILIKMNLIEGWLLYFFYVWVAIYAVLSASQFWVLANLVYNVREAKRLFGFIGSGAILGGISGGYLTSFLAPIIGSEHLVFLAAFLLLFCIPLLNKIWSSRVKKLGEFKPNKRTVSGAERPLRLIQKSKHLTYIASIVAVSVLVAKLVDYQFSDFAAAAIRDPEELTSFFAFWFSSFNLLSLGIQLFFTHRIVGIWGVGFSLLLLPIGIFAGSLFFLILPELSVVVVIKAMDGVLKQSVHKSATELLALPLSFELKNKTKSFIDVVVDSIATGVAGFLLVFVIHGIELPSAYISAFIMALVGVWVYFILQVRKQYYKTFRNNLRLIKERPERPEGASLKKEAVIRGMQSVFHKGTEEQILFMLKKLMEINDRRFEGDVLKLLSHESTRIRAAALQNLYFLNTSSMPADIPDLLTTEDEELTQATLEFLLLHAGKNSEFIYDTYLNHADQRIANASLYCLAREARDNYSLKVTYQLKERIRRKINESGKTRDDFSLQKILLKTIGVANIPDFYPLISKHFSHNNPAYVEAAIEAAGSSMHPGFVSELISFLPLKKHRNSAINALRNYGSKMVIILENTVKERLSPMDVCRFIPAALKAFNSQEAVRSLFRLLGDTDLSVRLEVVRALSDIRKSNPELRFNKYKIVAVIFEECKLYDQTLSAMHTQIVISYRNRKKYQKEVNEEERDARISLLELLERRLDAGLERIFRLLGLRYVQRDMEIAYEGLRSNNQEVRINAIEFLDNLLTGNLKRTLIPIIEESALDISSEEVLQKLKHKVPTELECFQLLLEENDLKLQLAVLYLIRRQKDPKFLSMVEKYLKSDDLKLQTFAREAADSMLTLTSASE